MVEEYWIDIQDQLNRVAYEYGNEKRYEKLVPIVSDELRAHEDKKCVLDFGNIKEINKELVKAIADVLKAYGQKGNNIHAAFASDVDKETFRESFPEKMEEYIILV